MIERNIEEQEADGSIDSDDGKHHQELPSFHSIKSINASKLASNMKKESEGGMPSFDQLPSVRISNAESSRLQIQMTDRSYDQDNLKYQSQLQKSEKSNFSNHQAKEENKILSENEENNGIRMSFLESARRSEVSSIHNQSQSEFGIEDQSFIQQQDSELNLGDQIGFLIPLNDKQVIGITLESAQFILFTFMGTKKTSYPIPIVNDHPIENMLQCISVKNDKNEIFIVISTSHNITILQVDLKKGVQISLVRQMKIVADCICQSFLQPVFYIASQNKIGKALIDITKQQKVAISKKKLLFSQEDQIKATAMAFIQQSYISESEDIEAYIVIGTSEFSVILLKVSKTGQSEMVFHLDDVHGNDITMIIPFSDSMNFVTLSLDGTIKSISMEGELDYETQADGGSIITGCAFPLMKDYYAISTQNMETNENSVSIYRRKKMLKSIQQINKDVAILDLKALGNYLFVINGGNTIERFNTKDF